MSMLLFHLHPVVEFRLWLWLVMWEMDELVLGYIYTHVGSSFMFMLVTVTFMFSWYMQGRIMLLVKLVAHT